MKEVVVYNKSDLTIEPVDTIQCSPYLYQPEITGEAYLMWDYGDRSGLTSAREHWYVNGIRYGSALPGDDICRNG